MRTEPGGVTAGLLKGGGGGPPRGRRAAAPRAVSHGGRAERPVWRVRRTRPWSTTPSRTCSAARLRACRRSAARSWPSRRVAPILNAAAAPGEAAARRSGCRMGNWRICRSESPRPRAPVDSALDGGGRCVGVRVEARLGRDRADLLPLGLPGPRRHQPAGGGAASAHRLGRANRRSGAGILILLCFFFKLDTDSSYHQLRGAGLLEPVQDRDELPLVCEQLGLWNAACRFRCRFR